MKLRSLLSLEGVGLESNRSSALTEYSCEQVKETLLWEKPLTKDLCFQEDVEVELRRELERLEVGSSGGGGREVRPHITIITTITITITISITSQSSPPSPGSSAPDLGVGAGPRCQHLRHTRPRARAKVGFYECGFSRYQFTHY